MHMKEKSSFTTEKPIDYTESKDASRETASYRDDTSLPSTKRPGQDDAGGE